MGQNLINRLQKQAGNADILIWGFAYNTQTAGTWAITYDANFLYAGYIYNSTNAINDQIDYKVYLSEGDYTVTQELRMGTTRAIVGLLIDGTLVSAMDTYQSSTINSKMTYPNPIHISTTGLKTLSYKILGQNGSSTGYYHYFWNTYMTRIEAI